MEIRVQPRQSGKTTELIKLSAETGAVIVVLNHNMIDDTKRLAEFLKLEIPEPITHFQFTDGRYRGGIYLGSW